MNLNTPVDRYAGSSKLMTSVNGLRMAIATFPVTTLRAELRGLPGAWLRQLPGLDSLHLSTRYAGLASLVLAVLAARLAIAVQPAKPPAAWPYRPQREAVW